MRTYTAVGATSLLMSLMTFNEALARHVHFGHSVPEINGRGGISAIAFLVCVAAVLYSRRTKPNRS